MRCRVDSLRFRVADLLVGPFHVPLPTKNASPKPSSTKGELKYVNGVPVSDARRHA